MRSALFFALTLLAEPAAAASFDGMRASTPEEVAVCGSTKLSALVDGSAVTVPAWVAATDMTVGMPPESRAMPAREGECARSRISATGGRIEGDTAFSSGTSVGFAEGGSQVSTDGVPGIVASRPGDPVLVCFTALPKRCPPGDDRGRSFTTTNLRTGRNWSAWDSEHRRGGA